MEPNPAPTAAGVYFFTRLGGVSEPPFDSLNISDRYGDEPQSVNENRRRIARAAGGESAFVRQVAGDEVVVVSEPGFAGEADALVTERVGLPLEVGVADCVPVALVGDRSVAMVHSGWRGTLAGISGRAVAMMREAGNTRISAYIGPSIRRCCYEVSEELAGDFSREFGASVVSGRNLSLQDAVVENLRRCGVEDIHDSGLCSGCRGDLFYSHRTQKPKTGRNVAVVVRRGDGNG